MQIPACLPADSAIQALHGLQLLLWYHTIHRGCKSLTFSCCLFLCARDAAVCFVTGCEAGLCFLPASDIWRWKMSVQRLEVPPS